MAENSRYAAYLAKRGELPPIGMPKGMSPMQQMEAIVRSERASARARQGSSNDMRTWAAHALSRKNPWQGMEPWEPPPGSDPWDSPPGSDAAEAEWPPPPALRNPLGGGMQRQPLEALGSTAQTMQLGRGAVDINVNLDRALSVGKSSTQSAEQFDIGFNVNNIGAPFARPGDPSVPIVRTTGMQL